MLRLERKKTFEVSGESSGLMIGVFRLQVSGIGAADAAMALTAVLSTEACGRVDAVLSVGCSGAHREDLGPGDVVLGTAAVPVACRMTRADGRAEHVGWRRVGRDAVPELPADAALLAAARRSLPIPLPPSAGAVLAGCGLQGTGRGGSLLGGLGRRLCRKASKLSSFDRNHACFYR